MIIDAIRRREWVWVDILMIFPGIGDALVFLSTCSAIRPTICAASNCPARMSRRRIKELQAQIHHLDKAHHHSQLGDIYFQRGKLAQAEACYRAAMERDPQDLDTRAHLGQCLLRLKRPAEARPLLESVVTENPKHDYGHTMMALAETLTALGETDNALLYWQHITQNHTYPRAKVQLAELYAAKNQLDLARAELRKCSAMSPHAGLSAPARPGVGRRARKLARKLA